MQSIEIDFEVFKELTVLRETEAVTYNDVLRRLLSLNDAGADGEGVATGVEAWVSKGVSFPVGTQFRVRYKGELHYAEVEKNGLVVNGNLAQSPSDAAIQITGNNVNGWRFWECRFPGHTNWRKIDGLRNS